MKKIKIYLLLALVLAVVISVLLYNKSKMESKSRPEIVSAIAVTVSPVTKATVSNSRTLVGTIIANNDVTIPSETQGKIVAVYANVGDYKPTGSVLFQVDDELKRAAFAAAEASFEKSKKDFERFQALQQQQTVSEQQYENARLALKNAEAQYTIARRQLDDTKIKTPISGVITARYVDVGATVQMNNVVANVVDISKLKVKVNVGEREAFLLNAGDKTEVETNVYPGVAFIGRIVSIGAKADDAHTYPVEILLDNNSAHPLKAGMFAKISFTSLSATEELTIPRQALLGSMKNSKVFVVEGDVAKLRSIVISGESGNLLLISSGLDEGDMVVVNGQNNLKDNASVTIAR
ncbi:MAG: efflux RND transporter periplasmic adaptor subunit [Bacteroidetes bacterium]|nr:MAG: efflux RND transporter periplasmic adaptor subunit [Bacteroidota bacterium]